MLKRDREAHIIRLLKEKASVSVAELSEAFQLSEVTVRKLLLTMERAGRLRRTWGGAVSAHSSLSDPSYEEKTEKNPTEKHAIALAAFARINDGDAVFLDSGTTALHLARLLAAGDKRQVLISTNALNIAMAFRHAEDMQVILIGGEFRHRLLSTTGNLACEALKTLFFDKGFITGSHFSAERGFTTPSVQEAEIKRAVLKASKETFALLDAGKYGDDSLALIAPCRSVGTLITDWRMKPEHAARLRETGLEVCVAKREGMAGENSG